MYIEKIKLGIVCLLKARLDLKILNIYLKHD